MIINFTGTTASNTTVSSVSSIAGLLVGQVVAGAGIPSGTTIAAISGSALTLSAAATATASDVAIVATVVGFTAVSASRIMDASGNVLVAGRATFFPVNNFGKPISAIAGGGGMIQQIGVVFLIVDGAITTDLYGGAARVADTALTTPENICYRISVTDGTGAEVQGPGYGLQQPTGPTFNLDTAPPNQPMQATIQGGPAGPQGEPGTGFNFRGPWAADTAYALGDCLTNGGNSYTPTVAFTSGSTFSTANLAVVAAGSIGATGETGATGATSVTNPFGNPIDFTQGASVQSGLKADRVAVSGPVVSRSLREYPTTRPYTKVFVAEDANGRSRVIAAINTDGSLTGIETFDPRIPAGSTGTSAGIDLTGTTAVQLLTSVEDIVTPSFKRWYPNTRGLSSVRIDANGNIIDGVTEAGAIFTGVGPAVTAASSFAVACVDAQPDVQPNALTTVLNHATITGQSLSTGQDSMNNAGGIGAGGTNITTTQPYSNVKFNTGVRDDIGSPPVISSLVPLVGDTNNGGASETCANGFADRVAGELLGFDLVHEFLVSSSGVPGETYAQICGPTDWTGALVGGVNKGSPSFQEMMLQITAGKALAPSTYAHRVVLMMHGETDAQDNNTNYTANLVQWQKDIQAGSNAITGRMSTIPIVMGQCIYPLTGNQELLAAIANPATHALAYPAYCLQHSILTGGVNLHLSPWGERMAGEYMARVYRTLVMAGKRWIPFVPAKVQIQGNLLLLEYQGNSGPVAIDSSYVTDPGNSGFTVADAGGGSIVSVTVISPNTIAIQMSQPPKAGTGTLTYAQNGSLAGPLGPTSGPRGCVRDSSPDISIYPNQAAALTPLYNYGLAFNLSY